jgi:dihydropteroate synthase
MLSSLDQTPRPLVFGVVNITPDSFSDGGDFFSIDASYQRCLQILDDGADYIDIGAESTRPGAKRLSDQEEWQRLEGILLKLKESNLLSKVSIDTRKSELMLKAAQLGVAWINCVGEIPSEDLLAKLQQINPNIGFIATHVHGDPETMQLQPIGPGKIVLRVEEYFESCTAQLLDAKLRPDKIYMDPGIGFGKTDSANLKLLINCSVWSKRINLAVGVSRKSIFQRLFGIESPKDRDPVSKVAELALAMAGVQMIRTHDVKGLKKGVLKYHEAMQ